MYHLHIDRTLESARVQYSAQCYSINVLNPFLCLCEFLFFVNVCFASFKTFFLSCCLIEFPIYNSWIRAMSRYYYVFIQYSIFDHSRLKNRVVVSYPCSSACFSSSLLLSLCRTKYQISTFVLSKPIYAGN